MGLLRRSRGFTLVEAMIVVVVIGILAVLAIVGYKAWIRTSYMAEAYDLIAHIRSAEESFKAENGVYLDISGALDNQHLYPAAPPGAFKTAWGGPCALCTHPWTSLTVQPQAPVAFGYALQAAGTPIITLTDPSTTPPNLTVLMSQPWYVVEAVGDINGDGIFTRVYGFSSTTQLLVDAEGN